MIRGSVGKQIDKCAIRNIEECIKNDIDFGLYFYSYALNESQVKTETRAILDLVKNYKDKIKYPIAIDMEDADGYKEKNGMPSNDMLVKICDTACTMIAQEGYFPMIYASQSWFMGRLRDDRLKGYAKWIAWWYEKAQFDKAIYPMWQKTSKGKVNGIDGNVDMNESFIDFPKVIDYYKRMVKYQTIMLQVGLEKKTITFFNFYKFGDFLIDKLYEGLKKEKIQRNEPCEKWKVIQEFFGLEDKTIIYLSNYKYHKELCEKLCEKLYEAIIEKPKLEVMEGGKDD